MAIISAQAYCQLANDSDAGFDPGFRQGYAGLPPELLAAEKSVILQDQAAAFSLNKALCRTLLENFTLTGALWTLPEKFLSLYQQQLLRIDSQLSHKPESYFTFSNDPFRKDLAVLRHRLIPCGAEFATPLSGISRRLLFRAGWRQAGRFIGVVATCRGISPFLELHMHPQYTDNFNPEGWIETYENLADLMVTNPSLRGVQSTSWFLDPALELVSPHLAYLRQIPEHCGATILYAGEDDGEHSGAFATSQTRRALYRAGQYYPKLFTRIWPRQRLLHRDWRSFSQ